jgi:hypothetical protein
VDAGLQVSCQRFVDGDDAVDGCADGLLHGDPGTFVAGAGCAGTSAEAGGAGELVEECVAFGADQVQPADVGLLFGLGEFLVEVADPLPVRIKGLLVEEVAEA